ncbi:MAG: hypothetical protein K0M64_06935 [Rhizobium sp.]|nr:hypothetical protein [Rhizobium sp.]
MGEAKRRGAFEQRRMEAIARAKRQLVEKLGGSDPERDRDLQRAFDAFVGRLGADEWKRRRKGVIDQLTASVQAVGAVPFVPLRVQQDEIAWYLLLAELALEDPLSLEVSQASRALPFLAAIGMRLNFADRVLWLNERFDDALTKYRADPDGTIFEVLVALSYASSGWDVELLPSSKTSKQPDMRAVKDGLTLYIECKRLSRSSEYGEKERSHFLEMWNGVSDLLAKNSQWLWLRANFKVEASALPKSFLKDLVSRSLPVPNAETNIYDGPEATIDIRHIDKKAVARHMEQYRVKMNSPAMTALLGGDWAPLDSAVSIATLVKISHVVDSPIEFLAQYVDEIGWASGITRHFTSPRSIAGKARDIRKRLADAVQQLPPDELSVVHIAYETMDGPDVEDLRFQRIAATLNKFVADKPLAGVRVHMLQAHQTIDQLWDIEESVAGWDRNPTLLKDIPAQVVVDPEAVLKAGRHWDAMR